MKRDFPPPTLDDLSRESAGAFMALAAAARLQPLTLFLGAGVSVSIGLPSWTELLERICTAFFYHWEFELEHSRVPNTRPPKELSIAFWESFFWTDTAQELGREFAKGDPVLAAQQIKNCIRDIDWRYLMRKVLYSLDDDTDNGNFTPSRLYEALARLCKEDGNVHTMINTNYDSLFEAYLTVRKVKHAVLWSPACKCPEGHIPIYHPHGYLKLGGGPATPIILAEDDYLTHANLPYHWANIVQLSRMTQSTCAFIGCSMTDPNIRRLLRTVQQHGKSTHYAFLPACDPNDAKKQMYEALFDADLGKLGVHAIRFPTSIKNKDAFARLPELLDLLPGVRLDPHNAWKGRGDT